MSVQPRSWPAPEVAAAVRAVYRRREPPLPVVVRDRLGEVFPDAEFAPGFGVRGRPGWSPGRLALVTVLQMAENLTDRQAADAIRDKISWKYALGLGLDDEGFDASVLSEFRTRVVEHGLEQRVLDSAAGRVGGAGAGGAGWETRTDSTHVISAVRDLNRLELAGESVRAALEAVAVVAPDWLRHGDRRGGLGSPLRRPCRYLAVADLTTKRAELVAAYGTDALGRCCKRRWATLGSPPRRSATAAWGRSVATPKSPTSVGARRMRRCSAGGSERVRVEPCHVREHKGAAPHRLLNRQACRARVSG